MKIQEAALGKANSSAVNQALYKAQVKRFPLVPSLETFATKGPVELYRTFRGNIKNNEQFDERLLIFAGKIKIGRNYFYLSR